MTAPVCCNLNLASLLAAWRGSRGLRTKAIQRDCSFLWACSKARYFMCYFCEVSQSHGPLHATGHSPNRTQTLLSSKLRPCHRPLWMENAWHYYYLRVIRVPRCYRRSELKMLGDPAFSVNWWIRHGAHSDLRGRTRCQRCRLPDM